MICKQCRYDRSTEDFYASNAATCKECLKARARSNREAKLDYYRSYDRKRYRENNTRKENAKRCGNSPAGMEARKRSFQRMLKTQPEKYKARYTVSNALRDGKMEKPKACFFCGAETKLQAHHHDYQKPLDVFWLCSPCHGKLHTVNGDFHRDREAV